MRDAGCVDAAQASQIKMTELITLAETLALKHGCFHLQCTDKNLNPFTFDIPARLLQKVHLRICVILRAPPKIRNVGSQEQAEQTCCLGFENPLLCILLLHCWCIQYWRLQHLQQMICWIFSVFGNFSALCILLAWAYCAKECGIFFIGPLWP